MMESGVHAAVPLRVGKKMRKRRELDALVGGPGSRSGRLLSASSDEGEPWGRRTSRRRRSRPFVRLAAALALCVCVVSAATVLWLFVDVRRQIVSLRIEMDRVTTTSGGVGDALQVCHTAAKELKANASELSARILKLELQHEELSQRMKNAQEELALVSGQLSAAPKLADTPRRIAELQRTVADFGSQIKGFDSAIESAHKQALTATSSVEELRNYVVHLEERTNDTIANVSTNWKKGEELKVQLVALNTTLGSRMDGFQAILDGMKKPVEKAAVSETPVATNAPTAAPISTTTLPPGPAKPSVLTMATS
ncbi:uncharacterized protein LOC123699379 isoform X1 [Colias croceus]|uniref:uncharacterized protein LOC123699379 isoform X1 n=1 Tax=Colias crocea TaxID=72248 RepID=UPI001E27BF11|nr:uncharacterized protein LOC123699379 isoform X1 [Colias croceus]XP_045502275.1 uncharacterized protein LOC123699379 isoform X1 [Colias croceus]